MQNMVKGKTYLYLSLKIPPNEFGNCVFGSTSVAPPKILMDGLMLVGSGSSLFIYQFTGKFKHLVYKLCCRRVQYYYFHDFHLPRALTELA